MEIKELVSYYINESSKTLDVTFRLINDGDDEVRNDNIELDEIKSFGYNFDNFNENPLLELYDDEDTDDLFGNFFDNDDYLETEEDEIKSFLNEYYLIYPNNLPNSDFF